MVCSAVVPAGLRPLRLCVWFPGCAHSRCARRAAANAEVRALRALGVLGVRVGLRALGVLGTKDIEGTEGTGGYWGF